MSRPVPDINEWLLTAKQSENAGKIGMYLTHNGVVRADAKAKVREGKDGTPEVTGMFFSYDEKKVEAAVASAKKMTGIYYVKVWLNEGELKVGEDIMYVLIGGDIRPNVIDALQALVSEIKNNCVVEKEIN